MSRPKFDWESFRLRFVGSILALAIILPLASHLVNAQQAVPNSPAAATSTTPVSGTVTANQGAAGVAWNVQQSAYQGASGTVQTPLEANTGVAANTAQTAMLTGAANKFTYLSHFDVSIIGATGAGCITISLTGLPNQLNYVYCVPAGTTTQNPPLSVNFNPPLQSSAVNTNIVLNIPAAGAGSPGQTGNVVGYLQ